MPRSLAEHVNLGLPHLPPSLDGMRIGHVSDTHVRRPKALHRRIIAELALQRLDLLLLTGDYMTRPGDEPKAVAFLEELTAKVPTRLGAFGVFGNHDTPAIREQLKSLPVRWLINQSQSLADGAIEVLGFDIDHDYTTDIPSLFFDSSVVENESSGGGGRPLRILLSHVPTLLPIAGDMGIDLMFSGHTHGGQCRLPTGHPLTNSTDLPLRLTSGILRHQNTLAIVTRGLGEARLPIRFFCPHQFPVCTLRRGPMLGEAGYGIVNLRPW